MWNNINSKLTLKPFSCYLPIFVVFVHPVDFAFKFLKTLQCRKSERLLLPGGEQSKLQQIPRITAVIHSTQLT